MWIKEQKERIEELKRSNRKSFYISKEDKKENENYEAYKAHFEKVLNATDFETSPWHIIDSNDKKKLARRPWASFLMKLVWGLKGSKFRKKDEENQERSYKKHVKILEKIDLEKTITDEEYDKEKKDLQKQVRDMAFEYYQRGISTVLVFEGVDAAGKDGAIERLVKR